MERVTRDPAHRVQVETFDYLDGVPGTALQLRPNPTAIETTDGQLWFLTTGGLVSIDPARIVRNPLPPPVRIEEIRVDDKKFADGNAAGPLKIPPGGIASNLNTPA